MSTTVCNVDVYFEIIMLNPTQNSTSLYFPFRWLYNGAVFVWVGFGFIVTFFIVTSKQPFSKTQIHKYY